MQKGIAFILLIFISCVCYAQSDTIQARIILIGDAGQLNYGREPVIDAARNLIPLNSKTTVIYLGDNIYDVGLPDDIMPGYEQAKAVIDSQINIAEGTDAKVFFIPGNHDWNNEGADGFAKVKRQGDYINSRGKPNVRFIPVDGCPGPVEYSISNDIELVAFDSQWFIRPENERPGIESDCPYKTPQQFYTELNDIINRNSKKLIILADHHTLKSNGIHGGFFGIKQHLFPLTDMKPNLWIPLPVIGSLYPIVRGVFGTPEDLHYPAYANLIDGVENVTKNHSNIIFVAGHEHTLQLIKDSSNYYIVSGAGSKHTRVSHSNKTKYATSAFGFAALEISKNKNVHVDFYTVTQDSAHHSYTENLFNFSLLKNGSSDTLKIADAKPLTKFKDSVTVAVDTSYERVSAMHKLISGRNYRKEWATPVHLKVFSITKEKGGFKILSLGSSGQSQSLLLEDKNKHTWELRTVDKDPSVSINEVLRPYIPDKLMKDIVSAEHPYAALVIPQLAGAAKVVHARPEYYFVPDDPALGLYRKQFSNKVCLLELRNPIPNEGSKSTSKVIDQVIDDSKNHIDQESVLRARLLDMMIGDWDRHFDQWLFGTLDTGVGKLYFPIPRNRDQAFFYSDGLFVRSLSIAALPYLQGFRKHYPNIKWFNWEERNFDRLFMNNLDESAWKRIITQFQANETNEVIDSAVKAMPPEIYRLDAKKTAAKLKSRRNLILKNGLKYYRFLSKEVNVVGSNKNEYFKIFNNGDSLEVKVFKRKRNNDSSTVMFDRNFSAASTKYINLYGLNGDDIFEADSTANSKIKLRIIGGKGKDTFNIKGKVRNVIYDFKPDSNFVLNHHKTKNEITADPNANFYDITGFNYNSYRLPLLSFGYNEDDKLIAGLGYSLKTYGFRKDPYATFQSLTGLYSFATHKYQVNYNGEFNHVINKYDIVARASVFHSVLNNFFGIGNDTKIDKAKDVHFYKVRYNYFSGDLLARKRFHRIAELNFGASYFHYWNNHFDNAGKILSQPSLAGLDSADVYSDKTYFGPKIAIIIHNTNKDLLPTRGVYWTTELTSLFGTNKISRQITKLTTDMAVYASFKDPTRLVTVLHLGYGHIFSEHYEYFQAMDLGQNNFLRGFRKNRFSGKSVFYESTEFRYKLFDSKSYLFPGAIGLIAFNDIGRVWVPNETSHIWHDAYGGGLYYSPYNFFIVSGTVAFSNEDRLFNFSIGTKFNITY